MRPLAEDIKNYSVKDVKGLLILPVQNLQIKMYLLTAAKNIYPYRFLIFFSCKNNEMLNDKELTHLSIIYFSQIV